jgi:hypothetical protein
MRYGLIDVREQVLAIEAEAYRQGWDANTATSFGNRAASQERPPIDVLRSALERTLANFEAVLARRPVRDATETIAEARAALAGGSVASPEPSE